MNRKSKISIDMFIVLLLIAVFILGSSILKELIFRSTLLIVFIVLVMFILRIKR